MGCCLFQVTVLFASTDGFQARSNQLLSRVRFLLLDAFVVLNLRIVVGGDCTQIIFAIIVAHALLLLLRWQVSSDPADMVESALIGPRATSVVARRHR